MALAFQKTIPIHHTTGSVEYVPVAEVCLVRLGLRTLTHHNKLLVRHLQSPLHLLGQDLDERFLNHGKVSARDHAHVYSASCNSAPA